MKNFYYPNDPFKEVMLEKFKYGLKYKLNQDVLTKDTKVDLEQYLEFSGDHIVATMRKDIYGLDKDLHVITYPKSGREVIKKSIYARLPKFLKKYFESKFPIKYTELRVYVRELYPTIVGQECYKVVLTAIREL